MGKKWSTSKAKSHLGMCDTNVDCRSCMLIRNIWCWTLESKIEDFELLFMAGLNIDENNYEVELQNVYVILIFLKFSVKLSSWMLWSTLIFGGIGTPLILVTQQLTWWFKVHLSGKGYVSRAMLISKLECWWTKFNVELSLRKLKSKGLTIELITTKLNCKM